METVVVGKRNVRIPVGALIAAIPEAVAAVRASAADNRDADSPGGAAVTPGEVAEDVAAFFQELAKAAGPAILRANGFSL